MSASPVPMQARCSPPVAMYSQSTYGEGQERVQGPRVEKSKRGDREGAAQGTCLLMKTKAIVWTRHGAGAGEVMTSSTSFARARRDRLSNHGRCEGAHQGRGTGGRGQGRRGEKGDGDGQGSGTSLISAPSQGLGLPSCGDPTRTRTDVSAYPLSTAAGRTLMLAEVVQRYGDGRDQDPEASQVHFRVPSYLGTWVRTCTSWHTSSSQLFIVFCLLAVGRPAGNPHPWDVTTDLPGSS